MTNKSAISYHARPMSLNVSIRKVFEAQKELSNSQNGVPKKGIKYPLSIHSFNKSEAYRKSLIEDIDKIYQNEVLAAHGSPTWVAEVSQQMTHSGESPLFLQKLLSPHKDGHTLKRPCSAKSVDAGKYYRPNSMHQYLSTTELRNHWQSEVNLKYGRPTRTTLLRARQRAGSAPVNAYEERRKQLEKEKELQASYQILLSSKETHEVDLEGESQHSFLTGARYNNTHILDSKSLYLYGVYMPRQNPTRYFINGKQQNNRKYQCPSAPPDSPRSTVISIASSPLASKKTRPKTAPGYGQRPSSRNAWGDNQSNASPRPGLYTGNIPSEPDSLLPSVKGMSVSKSKINHPPEPPTKSPPPTPTANAYFNGEEAEIILGNSKFDQSFNMEEQHDNDCEVSSAPTNKEQTGQKTSSVKNLSMEVVGESVENSGLSNKSDRTVSEKSRLTTRSDVYSKDPLNSCPECERQRLIDDAGDDSSDQKKFENVDLISRDISSAASSRIITIPSESETGKTQNESEEST